MLLPPLILERCGQVMYWEAGGSGSLSCRVQVKHLLRCFNETELNKDTSLQISLSQSWFTTEHKLIWVEALFAYSHISALFSFSYLTFLFVLLIRSKIIRVQLLLIIFKCFWENIWNDKRVSNFFSLWESGLDAKNIYYNISQIYYMKHS